MSILYIILALLGLSFLVFIHELGHYIVARRVGMRVDVFSIGFGKPIVSWMRKGVKWQIGVLPFGGYVKIAGMEKEKGVDPHLIKDGFYGKKPSDRIKVALAGPIVNIVFAFLAFTAVYFTGGREKPFSNFTKLIGWVDPQSPLSDLGVKPGDEITDYNGEAFTGFKDLLYAAVINGRDAQIEGNKIDYFDSEKTPYDYVIKPYQDPRVNEKGFKTVGVFAPANYLIFDKINGTTPNAIPEGSPMANSGIAYKDRILWVDGALVFSTEQLSSLMNDGKTLLTIQRGNDTFLTRVPRLNIHDLRLSHDEKDDLDDWRYELGLKGKVGDYLFIPYMISNDLTVLKSISFLDDNSEEMQASMHLKKGDKILAVDGQRVLSPYALLQHVQEKKLQIIVQENALKTKLNWKDEDNKFEHSANFAELRALVKTIGTDQEKTHLGNFKLLHTVVPVPFKDFPFTKEQKIAFTEKMAEERKEAQLITDSTKRKQVLQAIDKTENRLVLGVSLQDRSVIYNPGPLVLFGNVIGEMQRTMTALFTGHLSPKWMSGPVGIVQVVHHSLSVGVKEAIFWLAVISLNLGILNLLPIPVLDGGHICFSLYEQITKKRIKQKIMERMILPFVILLIGFFIYVTFHDVSRIFTNFFK